MWAILQNSFVGFRQNRYLVIFKKESWLIYFILLYFNKRFILLYYIIIIDLEKKSRRVKNIRTYYLSDDDFEMHEKLEDIAYKERVALSVIIVAAIQEYVIKHGDGNPVYSLDHFTGSLDMKAVPAVFRDRGIWDKFLQECNPTLRQEILWQSQTIGSLATKWKKYE